MGLPRAITNLIKLAEVKKAINYAFLCNGTRVLTLSKKYLNKICGYSLLLNDPDRTLNIRYDHSYDCGDILTNFKLSKYSLFLLNSLVDENFQ